jgi:hypothetical protein
LSSDLRSGTRPNFETPDPYVGTGRYLPKFLICGADMLLFFANPKLFAHRLL